MPWLSCILPKSSPLLQFTSRNDIRARQGKQRRTMVNLESLESRTLLAGNVTVSSVVGGVLTITGDTHQDQFRISENGGNSVTVVGTPLGATRTSINGLPINVSVNRLEVTSINVVLSGPNGNTSDVIELAGLGKAVATGIKNVAISVTGSPAVTLNAHDLDNTGTLSLVDGTSSVAGGWLSANVTNSQFAALSIYQTGCCLAYVELDNDNVPGTVAVTEGVQNGDSIFLDKIPTAGDHFGSTSLVQGAGPTMTGCNGNGDKINVRNAAVKDLTLTQAGGTNVAINVNGVTVILTSFGVLAQQGNGGQDVIAINAVTAPGTGLAVNNLHGGPPNIITTQLNGNDDVTVVSNSVVPGNIEITQGNGNGDYAAVLTCTAGFTATVGPYVFDFYGDAEISQGNGYADMVALDVGNSFNNVYITQGDSIAFPGCVPGLGDEVDLNDTTVTSDLSVNQGQTALEMGNNVVNIAATSVVTVGDSTSINEIGANSANNTISLGGASGGPDSGSIDFETGYLDVYTGAGGGAYVQVWNTLVDYGALGSFGPDNINGDGDGSVSFLDDTSALTVTSAF